MKLNKLIKAPGNDSAPEFFILNRTFQAVKKQKPHQSLNFLFQQSVDRNFSLEYY